MSGKMDYLCFAAAAEDFLPNNIIIQSEASLRGFFPILFGRASGGLLFWPYCSAILRCPPSTLAWATRNEGIYC